MKKSMKTMTFPKNPSSSKRRRMNRLLLALGCFLSVCSGTAQNPLSLEEAIKEGLANNYDIRMAFNRKEMVKKDVSLGNAGFLPEVTASASYDEAFLDASIKVVRGDELENPSATSKLTTAGIAMKWTLFDGTAMMVKYEKLKTLSRAEELQWKDQVERSVADIILAWCEVIRQAKLKEAWQQKLGVSDFRVKLAEQRKTIGAGSEYEYLQAQVNRQADTAKLLSQTAAVTNAVTRLNELLACDLNRAYTFPDSFPLLPLPELSSLLTHAAQNNNVLLNSRLQLEVQDLETRALKAKRYPYLVFRSSYNYYENETEASFIKYMQNLGPQVGITAGISLFDGNNLNRNISRQKLLRENANLRYQLEQQSLNAGILKKYNEYTSQAEVVKLNQEGVDLAEKNMKIATEAYQVGMLSSLQFREAQDQLYEAAASLIQAQYQLKACETALLRMGGGLVK